MSKNCFTILRNTLETSVKACQSETLSYGALRSTVFKFSTQFPLVFLSKGFGSNVMSQVKLELFFLQKSAKEQQQNEVYNLNSKLDEFKHQYELQATTIESLEGNLLKEKGEVNRLEKERIELIAKVSGLICFHYLTSGVVFKCYSQIKSDCSSSSSTRFQSILTRIIISTQEYSRPDWLMMSEYF